MRGTDRITETRPDRSELPGSPRALRIAHVIPGLHYGGMERLLSESVPVLSARGVENHVVAMEALGRFAELIVGDASIHLVPPMSRASLIYPARLVALFREIRPDIVHSHAGVWFKAAWAARLAGVPVSVHTDHGRPVPDRRSDRLIDNLASRHSDRVIAVSEALAEVLRRYVVHDPARVTVIHNGVRVPAPITGEQRHAVRQALGIGDNDWVIGSVGRLEPVKNYRLALEAFAGLESTPQTPVLVLVGDGSQRGELENVSESLGIRARVRFLGWRDDITDLHSAFDLFTLTSNSEGTSVSLLEAMGRGLCPVVTDVGGNRVVLGAGLSSLLVPSGDRAAVTTAWRACLENAGARAEFGKQARHRVIETFSLERMVAAQLALYHQLLPAGAPIRTGG